MSAMAAGRRLLHLLPGLELCLRSRALTLLSPSRYLSTLTPRRRPTPTDFSAPKFTNFRFFCRADGMARCWREPPRRKLVTFRQGAFEEGNAGEALMMLQKWSSIWCSLDHFGLI